MMETVRTEVTTTTAIHNSNSALVPCGTHVEVRAALDGEGGGKSEKGGRRRPTSSRHPRGNNMQSSSTGKRADESLPCLALSGDGTSGFGVRQLFLRV
ncbi:hypothetical protein CKAH01_01383 [Colletotrichum kahawae]|uniref:Uncharacterized protein n=1 Tax=Colletotrichum kahawae TaxID=34407 RepID=A0AAD9Y7I2_COLKA|nr:hypothetical protein CKAH01_01383 [Colletotrichum kahawae]